MSVYIYEFVLLVSACIHDSQVLAAVLDEGGRTRSMYEPPADVGMYQRVSHNTPTSPPVLRA